MPLPLPKISHTLLGEREKLPKKWGNFLCREGKNRGWGGGRETRKGIPCFVGVQGLPSFSPKCLLHLLKSSGAHLSYFCMTKPVPEPLSSLGAPPGYKPGYKLNSPLKRKTPKRRFPSLPCGHCTDTRRKPVRSDQPAPDAIPKAVMSRIRGCEDAVWQGREQGSRGLCGPVAHPCSRACGAGGSAGRLRPLQRQGCGSGESCARCGLFPSDVASEPDSQTLLEVLWSIQSL